MGRKRGEAKSGVPNKRGVGDTFNRLPIGPADLAVQAATRDTAGWNDSGGLVFVWIALVATIAIAITARSVVLGIVALGIALIAIPWTTGKLQSRAEARRLARRHD